MQMYDMSINYFNQMGSDLLTFNPHVTLCPVHWKPIPDSTHTFPSLTLFLSPLPTSLFFHSF